MTDMLTQRHRLRAGPHAAPGARCRALGAGGDAARRRSRSGRAVEMIDAAALLPHRATRRSTRRMVALYNRSERADLITLTEELRRRGDLESDRRASRRWRRSSSTRLDHREHREPHPHRALEGDPAEAHQGRRATSSSSAYAGQRRDGEILDRAEAAHLRDHRRSACARGSSPLKRAAQAGVRATSRSCSSARCTSPACRAGYDDLDKLTVRASSRAT